MVTRRTGLDMAQRSTSPFRSSDLADLSCPKVAGGELGIPAGGASVSGSALRLEPDDVAADEAHVGRLRSAVIGAAVDAVGAEETLRALAPID